MHNCGISRADDLYDEWLQAAKITDHDQKLYAIKDNLKKLHTPNHDTLLCLMRFLVKVTSLCDKNKMKASNLGIISLFLETWRDIVK